MCVGNNQPAPPQIIYQGPSQEDIDRNAESLQKFSDDIDEQNRIFNEGIQKQIDDANAATLALEEKYADDLGDAQTDADASVDAANTAAEATVSGAEDDATATTNKANTDAAAQTSAAAGAANAQQVGALTVTTQETEAELPQTTTSNKKKVKDPKKTLKINTGGAQASAGAGVNLGI